VNVEARDACRGGISHGEIVTIPTAAGERKPPAVKTTNFLRNRYGA
jgi:hypothetical protein